jgi:hypothetical protein
MLEPTPIQIKLIIKIKRKNIFPNLIRDFEIERNFKNVALLYLWRKSFETILLLSFIG